MPFLITNYLSNKFCHESFRIKLISVGARLVKQSNLQLNSVEITRFDTLKIIMT